MKNAKNKGYNFSQDKIAHCKVIIGAHKYNCYLEEKEIYFERITSTLTETTGTSKKISYSSELVFTSTPSWEDLDQYLTKPKYIEFRTRPFIQKTIQSCFIQLVFEEIDRYPKDQRSILSQLDLLSNIYRV